MILIERLSFDRYLARNVVFPFKNLLKLTFGTHDSFIYNHMTHYVRYNFRKSCDSLDWLDWLAKKYEHAKKAREILKLVMFNL